MVNIFGGIVDCSIVANGITSAYKRLNVQVPVIVRLEGKCELDREILFSQIIYACCLI